MSKRWAEILRQQNGDRLKLEHDLLREEQESLEKLAEEEERKRRQLTDKLSDGLMDKLHGKFV